MIEVGEYVALGEIVGAPIWGPYSPSGLARAVYVRAVQCVDELIYVSMIIFRNFDDYSDGASDAALPEAGNLWPEKKSMFYIRY